MSKGDNRKETPTMMNNAVAQALVSSYRFEDKADHLFTGIGSWLACHETIEVSFHGDMVTIRHYQYFWDGGDVEWERSTVVTCHLAQLWENLPEWVYTRRW